MFDISTRVDNKTEEETAERQGLKDIFRLLVETNDLFEGMSVLLTEGGKTKRIYVESEIEMISAKNYDIDQISRDIEELQKESEM